MELTQEQKQDFERNYYELLLGKICTACKRSAANTEADASF